MVRKRKKPIVAPRPTPAAWPPVVFPPPPIRHRVASATEAVTVFEPPPPIRSQETPATAPIPVQVPAAIIAEALARAEPGTAPTPPEMIQAPTVQASRNWTVPVAVPVIQSQIPAPPTRPALVLDDGRRIEFGRRALIGRAPVAANPADVGSVIALSDSDRSVSNTHLRIEIMPAGPCVTDVGSATGVQLRYPNGMVLPTVAGVRAPVEPGVTVLFGQRSLQIAMPETY